MGCTWGKEGIKIPQKIWILSLKFVLFGTYKNHTQQKWKTQSLQSAREVHC